jgi:hypothetical protein
MSAFDQIVKFIFLVPGRVPSEALAEIVQRSIQSGRSFPGDRMSEFSSEAPPLRLRRHAEHAVERRRDSLRLPAQKSSFAEIHIFEQLRRPFPPCTDVSLVVRRNSIVGSIVGFSRLPEHLGFLQAVGAALSNRFEIGAVILVDSEVKSRSSSRKINQTTTTLYGLLTFRG